MSQRSPSRSRTEILSEFFTASGRSFADAPPAPAVAKTPPPPGDDIVVPDDNADAGVAAALVKAKAAVQEAITAQKSDTDTDPIDKEITQGLAQIDAMLDAVTAKQAEDNDANDAPKGDAPPPGDDATAPDAPSSTPMAVDATPPVEPDGPPKEGDIEPSEKCETEGCAHLASAHQDTEIGANTGACSMCSCEQMSSPQVAEPTTDNAPAASDGATPGVPAAPADGSTAARGATALAVDGAEDAPTADAPAAPSAPNTPPAVDATATMGPAFTIPVGVIEGQPTGDGRVIEPNALTWRAPPLPLMGLDTSPHDPSGFSPNDPAVMCGRIDSLTRVPGEGGTQVIMANGFYFANDDGMHFADLTDSMGRCGISADISVGESNITAEIGEDGFPANEQLVLLSGEIAGFTQCPFPAFTGCYIVLGDGAEGGPAPIPQTVDDAAKPPDAVAAGGQLIHWMMRADDDICEPCADGIEVVIASGAGPLRPPKAWFENPYFTEGDGRLVEMTNGRSACPITITDDGEIFGHIAPWGVCHTGASGTCIIAPKSKVDYAHFKRAQHVVTAEGEKVRVGTITGGVGHAGESAKGGAAMAHYDNAAWQVAKVNIGEDSYGIWIHGQISPHATDEQIELLRSTSPSGDWRNMGAGLELVAALAVNQPGFPIAQIAASGAVMSLVAAGVTEMTRLMHPALPEASTPLQRALLGAAKAFAKSRLASLSQ
jgi:hypothetical protein